jgi:hypothetical protein
LPTPPTKVKRKYHKRSECKHCFKTNHSNIRSIECLRNPKNPNFIPLSENIEPRNEIPQSENAESLEYTLNTQNLSQMSEMVVDITSLPNTSLFIANESENSERIRSPLQIINNRSIMKKNYNNRRQLISETQVRLFLLS